MSEIEIAQYAERRKKYNKKVEAMLAAEKEFIEERRKQRFSRRG